MKLPDSTPRLLLPLLAPFTLLALFVLAPPTPARAEDEATRTLDVGTKEAPPFSFRDANGTWHGITIDLLERIAEEANLRLTYEETDLDGLIAGVETGRFDVAAAALTVTSEREARIDFSHPYYMSGLGIAARREGQEGLLAVMGRVFSSRFLAAILGLAGILATAGLLLWIFEHKKNAEQFGGSTARGLGAAFWWSAVTMTTVGYGDKSPVTVGGRLVAIFWMFASIILIAGLTGAIASALTVSELEGSIQGPEDLPGKRVGAVKDSTGAAYLSQAGLRRVLYDDPAQALSALADGDLDAVVHDRPLLAWAVASDPALASRIQVLHRTFDRQDYALALPPGAARREELNRIIVRLISEPWWDEVVGRYLGG